MNQKLCRHSLPCDIKLTFLSNEFTADVFCGNDETLLAIQNRMWNIKNPGRHLILKSIEYYLYHNKKARLLFMSACRTDLM